MAQFNQFSLDPEDYPGGPGQVLDGTQGGGGGGVPAPPFAGDTGGFNTVLPEGGVGVGGGGGMGMGGGMYVGKPQFNFEDAPEFTPPQFQRPTFEQAQQTPGYRFRLDGGRQALERSAAARGSLRTGGTLKDIEEYGQNFASSEYGNTYNQALQAHDRDFQGAYAAFQPRFQEWQTLTGAELQAAMAQYNIQHRRTNMGGGGGGGGFDPNSVAPPPPPGAPPFSWKNGSQNPDVLAWQEYQRNQGLA